jgi:hypothetical protein
MSTLFPLVESWDMLSPQRLIECPTILLHKSTSICLLRVYHIRTKLYAGSFARGIYDGKFGQVVDDGQSFMYTLNADYLPAPPDPICELQLR